MDLSKIKVGSNPDKINAVIEIPYGSNIKYEIDKASGALCVDRVLYGAMFYPANYGFVPNTLADDGDPADVLVLNEYPLVAGSVIPCRLIGVLMMEDESGMDEKLLAVPVTAPPTSTTSSSVPPGSSSWIPRSTEVPPIPLAWDTFTAASPHRTPVGACATSPNPSSRSCGPPEPFPRHWEDCPRAP